nr:hypothetical protein [Tanacetum cinerariifolium]
MGRNLDKESGKFLMYPRFIQVFLDKQLERLSNHKRKYVAPSHTKKIFGNMRRVEKGFSGNITPLFPATVFWTTAKARSINREAHIHAKIDGKKVIISKASIRRDLQFADEGGVDCLPNDTMFEQLSLIG